MSERHRLVIRTPHETVLDEQVRAARVPTETGQVGLRPRGEPFVLIVEPGLVILRMDDGIRFAATAGGLLDCDREQSVLYTPFAVVGGVGAEVLTALDRAFAMPESELVARRRLAELEQHIVRELRTRPRVARTEHRP